MKSIHGNRTVNRFGRSNRNRSSIRWGIIPLLMTAPLANADHNRMDALDCGGTLTCSVNPVIDFTYDGSNGCVPSCMVTAQMEANGTDCVPTGTPNFTLRFSENTDSSALCSDAADPDPLAFTLGVPFELNRAGMCEIEDWRIMDLARIAEGQFTDGVNTDVLRFKPRKDFKDLFCIPTVSTWGLCAMVGLLLAAATVVVRRRRLASGCLD